jgi:hypothetical protein
MADHLMEEHRGGGGSEQHPGLSRARGDARLRGVGLNLEIEHRGPDGQRTVTVGECELGEIGAIEGHRPVAGEHRGPAPAPAHAGAPCRHARERLLDLRWLGKRGRGERWQGAGRYAEQVGEKNALEAIARGERPVLPHRCALAEQDLARGDATIHQVPARLGAALQEHIH